MKKLFCALLAVAALASCSKDEVLEMPQKAIDYGVVTNKVTKAVDVYCSNNLMSSFNVWAAYNNGTNWISYFADESVEVTNSDECTPTSVRYWPDFSKVANSKLKFYGLAGTDNDIVWTNQGNSAPTLNYTVKDAVADQEDVLYALSKDYTSVPSGNKVGMNFRHALSLVEFKANNNSANLYVEVSKVCVSGVNNTGIFTFPTEDTDTNYEDHFDIDGTEDNDKTGKGGWDGQSGSKEYIVALTETQKVNKDETKNLTYLTAEDGSTVGYYKNSMVLMPQTTSAYDGSAGAFMGVYCKIYNVAGVAYASSSDVLLYEGWALVPVTVNWEPGKKYVYTFKFNNGNGGTDGGGTDDPTPTDKPVLFDIDYTVYIDDFDLITTPVIPMEK